MSDSANQPLKRTSNIAQASAPEDILRSEPTVLTIEQLNLQIKQILEGQVGLVWVRGEISNFKAHTSGHHYFSLKDAKSQISAVMFRGNNSRLKFKIHDGLEVLARGRIAVYEPRGNYQIVCDMMEPVGAGALQKAFEQLKEKLKKEGLFDPAKKRAIPTLPKHVAIVTSPTGAAIRDILNILSRRAASVPVTIVPTLVQGDAAALQIVEALKKAAMIPDVDVIICGRGGGSIEDMWCFNDERVARAIAASPIPVISAVGHEIDFTIADFVADLRAPTPSAAAELVARSSIELSQKIQSLKRMLNLAMQKQMKMLLQKIDSLSRRLVDPKRRLEDLRIRNDDLLNRLEMAIQRRLENTKNRLVVLEHRLVHPSDLIAENRKEVQHQLNSLTRMMTRLLERKEAKLQRSMGILDSLSPLKVVDRGYSIVTKEKEVIKSVNQISIGDRISIRLAEGQAEATIDQVKG